jgi:tRNA threonylcarbamoyladenosine biosynthesis protein TsaE
MQRVTHSVEETRAVGAEIARSVKAGDVIGLVGELGAGKTEFVRGFVHALAPDARVQSPSFSLLNTYVAATFPVYHFDFYRLSDARELTEIGLADYLRGDGVCLIEWAEMFPEVLPENVRMVRIVDRGPSARSIDLS